ncbi:MAG: exosome complex RNA-binding protein Rrp4 [Candidatus Aenigmarchaeota archaeon]|nr:exosome complex RNA-binding protein Rrp4 [Candidatus Aenigmarchaeota archaeon]MDW8149216.1 exosome complex RNA-binding protein Rrp4 [Candidatus Aenigmarchaeota archaeon]
MKVREIVLTGQYICEEDGRKISNTVYKEGGKVFSKVVGVLKITDEEINIIPLKYVYIPKVGDRVIGIIKEVETSGWIVDINSPYLAFLPLAEVASSYVDVFRTDLSKFYNVNDIIYTKVIKVSEDKVINISMKDEESRKLKDGVIVSITPTKVARVIGRGGSMIETLKKGTKSEIIVGQNGYIFISGGKVEKAIEAILTIERESHLYGLTDKIKELLKNE